jgi:Protein of unknown function (DUF2852)
LAMLAYLIWSGRMIGCGRDIDRWKERAMARWERRRARWEAMHGWGSSLRPTGNRAFDEYRTEALRRLEEEANEFQSFLERLRLAKDRAEFDDFMRERRNRPGGGGERGAAPGPEQPA